MESPTRFFGKLCIKHPELKGERKTANKGCIACVRESVHKAQKKSRKIRYQTDPEFRLKEDARTKDRLYKKRAEDPEYRARESATQVIRARERYLVDAEFRLAETIRKKKYRAARKGQMPAWADRNKIAAIYREAKKLGLTVDHIIPLHGKSVSGLHVHNNLQLLPGPENFGKGNRYELG